MHDLTLPSKGRLDGSLQVLTYRSDPLAVVRDLLCARIALEIQDTQVRHAREYLHQDQVFLRTASTPNWLSASGKMSGSQILLSCKSKVEMVVSTR